MTQKRRSKVRPQEEQNATADAVPEAYGLTPVERLDPAELVERYPEGPRDTGGDGVVTITDASESFFPFNPPVMIPEDTESVVQGIIHQIETSPRVRDAIARLMATNAAITKANGGEPPVAYLKAMAREMDAQHERAEGRVATYLAPDLTLILGELWTVRLAKMADAAGQTPTQYLQTLLARAWTAMPRRSRGEG